MRYPFFRFTALEQRDGLRPSSPHIKDFGVTFKGCAVTHTNLTARNSSMTLAVPPDAVVDGWYFVTDAVAPENDPVNFTLSASRDLDQWSVHVCLVHTFVPRASLRFVILGP